MIEGLRCLPFFHSAERQTPSPVEDISNCGRCMQRNNAQARKRLGCGYEKPSDRAVPWSPAGMRGKPLTVCPGYTTKLPEVVEVSWARMYFEKGSLAQWSDTPITEQTRAGIQVLATAVADEQAYQIEEQRRKAAR